MVEGSRWKQRHLPQVDYADPTLVVSVTIRARAGLVPFTDPRLAQEVIASLHWLRQHRGVHLYAYCLMPDHLHLLLQSSDGAGLGSVIGQMKRYTTHRSWQYGYQGALWQARFYDHLLRSHEDLLRIVRYILANPVRRGLSLTAEEYPYSALPDPLP